MDILDRIKGNSEDRWGGDEDESILDINQFNTVTDEEGNEEVVFNEDAMDVGEKIGEQLSKRVERNQINTLKQKDDVDEFDEEDFFTNEDGTPTIVTRYDFEKQVPAEKKTHFQEIDRYWVNKPYAFISLFRSTKENEVKYYAIEPYMNELEEQLSEYIKEKLRDQINYDMEIQVDEEVDERKEVLEEETIDLLKNYGYYDEEKENFFTKIINMGPNQLAEYLADHHELEDEDEEGYIQHARPDYAELEEEIDILTDYQLEKILYYLKRDSLGYRQIDPIKNDINIEDISCDGYNSPVFVYHTEYEQIISNVYHGEQELDDFVVDLAQRSSKGISKRNPQVDVTLPDGSRGQLTLGSEVSDHGTNYTIRQFKDVPFTPIDLINWRTFSLDQMAFLWLCIQNHKSLIFAGGTASGKTTSLNAVSLFIPSSAKIVSIEDTREVELPQRNWIASVTRPSFSGDDKGDVDEFDLLEAALRQRPDYIVMGEIRGEEGRTAFQVMSTGHTTYTTFHADSVGEVLKRFTTDPINVSKTMFTALDLVSIQTATRVNGNKVRRNKSLTEINHYDAENDEINVQDVYQWQAETDSFIQPGDSQILEDIKFDRGWKDNQLKDRIQERQIILAYLIDRGLNTYAQVAATFQAYMNDRETILTLIADNRLEHSLENLREMESVLIDVDKEDEERTPRPGPDDDMAEQCKQILREGQPLLEEYEGQEVNLEDAIPSVSDLEQDVDVTEETKDEENIEDLLNDLTEEMNLGDEETEENDIEVV